MRVILPQKQIDKFKKVCKAAFPNERYALLLGRNGENVHIVTDIFIPEEQEPYSTNIEIVPQSAWFYDAQKLAEEKDVIILGDIHSHCIDRKGNKDVDSSPSEADWDGGGWLCSISSLKNPVFGILSVYETKVGHRTRLRLWPKIEKIAVRLK